MVLYFVGYWKIDWVRARWPDRQRLLDGALAIVARHPWRASLSVRFAYGLRLPLPSACGAARVPMSLYGIASGRELLALGVARRALQLLDAFDDVGGFAYQPAAAHLEHVGGTNLDDFKGDEVLGLEPDGHHRALAAQLEGHRVEVD